MYQYLVILYRWVLGLGSMLLFGSICLILVLVSFGGLRNFCNQYIFSYTSRMLLRLIGYTYELPARSEFPRKQVLYTINHNSYLDTFLLSSVGIPDTRYILSEKTLKFIPMIVAAKAIGTWYIPQQWRKRRRLNFFIKKTAVLKRTNLSVIAAAEGVHEFGHTIAPFNRGIFHMALEAGIPIVPLFIYTPEEANPLIGKYSKTGKLKLCIMEEIDTSNWNRETLREEIDKVRSIYVAKFNELNNTNLE